MRTKLKSSKNFDKEGKKKGTKKWDLYPMQLILYIISIE